MRAAIRFAQPLSRLRTVAWVVLLACAMAPVAAARPPGVTPPPKHKTPAAKGTDGTQAIQVSKAAQEADPKPEVPPVPQVSSDGTLSRSDLIQLAIQSHPNFWRFRGEVAYYLQAEAAAYDWRDPELRIGFDHEFESDIASPYTESRSIETIERGFFDTTTQSFFSEVGKEDDDGNRDTTTGSTLGRQTTSQDRRITTERVRKVTEGKYEDVIDETVYEVERRNENQTQSRRGPGSTSANERSSESSRRRVLSRSREYRKHPNDVYGDDQFSVTARLFIPNPWEVRARAARARAEAGLSNQRLRTEVRELVFDVGRRYDELQFRYAWHQANLRLLELMQRNLEDVEESADRILKGGAAAAGAALYDPAELPRARLLIIQAREELIDSGRELAMVKEELGQLCGVNDPGRIVLTNALRLRKISEQHLDQASLVELARANRADLGQVKARGDIERARLREVKALRVPWINDLRVGYSRTTSDGYRDQDEISALLTFNFPLFSWWQNKSHRQHEDAIANFEQAQRVMSDRIEGQVTFAIRSVRDAASSLAEFSRSEALDIEDLKKNEAEAKVAGDRAGRMLLAIEEARVKSNRGRLQALYRYNQSVAHLELALGVPLEEALAPASPSAKAPAAK